MLRFRAPEPSDIDYIYTVENDPDTWNAGALLAPISRHTIQQMVASTPLLSESAQLRFVLYNDPDPTPLGLFDLFNIDLINHNASVGLIVYPVEFRNKGIARQALYLLEEYAFLHAKLHQLYCEIDVENIPSIKLFLGAGFEVIGTKKEWIRRANNHFSDILCLQKICGTE